MPFTFTSLELAGAVLIEPRVFADGRGAFLETFKQSDFDANGLPPTFVQENQSMSSRGALRGLHFQRPPHGQGKLIRVIQGEIFDVGVDLRRGSETYGKWMSIVLSSENRRMLYLPPWFAHGFLVTSDTAEVIYKTTTEYRKEAEDGLLWNDPALSIPWSNANPILSPRDERLPKLADVEPVVADDLLDQVTR